MRRFACRGKTFKRQLGPRDDVDVRAPVLACDLVGRDARRGVARRRSKAPAAAPPTAQAPARLCAVSVQSSGTGCSGPIGPAIQVLARDLRSLVPSRRRASRERSISTGCAGSAASRSLASASAAARSPLISRRAPRGRDRRCRAIPASPSRPRRSRWAARPRSSPAARPEARRSPAGSAARSSNRRSRRSAGHGRTAAPSCGTARALRCAARCAASAGDAHIWSSRRPRSFLVQSGER